MSFRDLRLRIAFWASVFLLFLAASQGAFADTLVSVAFTGRYPSAWNLTQPPIVSGPEAAATAANPLFGAANVWNNLMLTQVGFAELTDPSWSGLVNSAGSNSGVDFSITGTVIAAVQYGFLTNPDPLRSDYIAFNNDSSASFPGISSSISWTLSGLAPGGTYDMCIYGSRTDYDRNFNMTIQGTTLGVPTYKTTDVPAPAPDCVYFSNLVASSTGTITGVGTGIGSANDLTTEADWSGFQLARVPEPSTLLLVSFAGLALVRRCKRCNL